MANKKISTLTNSLTKATVATNDLTVVVDTSASESKKMTYGELMSPTDSNFRIAGSSDNTKLVAFEVDGLTTATTRTVTVPDADMTLVGVATTQTLTNKTLTSPQVNFGSDANGDLIYRNGAGVTSRLAIGSTDQILAVQEGLPVWIANPAASDASTTVKGVVEIATDAEVNAGTSTGATGAILAIPASSAGAVAANKIVQFTAATKYPAADGSLITNIVLPPTTLNNIPNAIPTNTSIYHTYTAFPSVYNDGGTERLAGARMTGTIALTNNDGEGAGGGALFLTSSATGSIESYLPCLSSTIVYRLLWNHLGSNAVYLKMRVAPVGNGTTPTYGWGFAEQNEVNAVYNSTAVNSARFVFNGTTLYATTSKATVGVTNTNVTGALTIANRWHIYEIVITSTTHLFYIDGVLVATHTTNIPNTSGEVYLAYGMTSGSTSEMALSPAIISLPNTAS